jgi:multidrug efflux pump
VAVKSDADSNQHRSMTIQSDQRNAAGLSQIANDVFKERLQTIAGVSAINVWGEKKYSMKLLLEPVKMAGFNVTPVDVRNALNRENVELPSGRIEGFNTELSIRTLGRLTTAEEFNASSSATTVARGALEGHRQCRAASGERTIAAAR